MDKKIEAKRKNQQKRIESLENIKKFVNGEQPTPKCYKESKKASRMKKAKEMADIKIKAIQQAKKGNMKVVYLPIGENFEKKCITVRDLALSRIEYLITTEEDLRTVATCLKVVNDIITNKDDEKPSDEVNRYAVDFFKGISQKMLGTNVLQHMEYADYIEVKDKIVVPNPERITNNHHIKKYVKLKTE